MKYLISGNSIVMYGSNRKMELQRFLLILPVAILGYSIFPIILLYSHMFIAKAASILALISFSVLLIIFMISICKAHNSRTIIDKSNHSIKFVSSGKIVEHASGDFKSILIEEVGIYHGAIYKAHLTSSDGSIELGLVANTKWGLKRKIKPLIDYLDLPIEEKFDDSVIHIFGK